MSRKLAGRALGLAVALLAAGCGSDSGLHLEQGGRTVKLPAPTTGPVTPGNTGPRSIQLGGSASAAYGAGVLWAAVRPPGPALVGSLVQIDPATSRRTGAPLPLPASDAPYLLAVGEGGIWLAAGDRIWKIDPRGSAPLAQVPAGGRVTGLLAAQGAVWAIVRPAAGPGRLLRIDPARGRVLRTTRLGLSPSAVTAVPGAVWVADAEARTVTRIEPGSGRATATIRLPVANSGAPSQITVYAGVVWVYQQDAVVRIDPATNSVTGSTAVVPVRGGTLAAGSGGIWVLTSTPPPRRAALERIDARGHPGRAEALGGHPSALVTGGGAVWVIDARSGTIRRFQPGG
jgi:hypothetical protein